MEGENLKFRFNQNQDQELPYETPRRSLTVVVHLVLRKAPPVNPARRAVRRRHSAR